jgi:hypothetical protein
MNKTSLTGFGKTVQSVIGVKRSLPFLVKICAVRNGAEQFDVFSNGS